MLLGRPAPHPSSAMIALVVLATGRGAVVRMHHRRHHGREEPILGRNKIAIASCTLVLVLEGREDQKRLKF